MPSTALKLYARSRTSLGVDPKGRGVLFDIGAIFGPYTYLASEVVFGAVAVGLLVRAGAVAQAGKTILVLYPVAYVWDWYTLTIGVFSIELRTGVDFLGIPIEEHLFMVVVPALVIGVHETLRNYDDSAVSRSLEQSEE